ncbi:MAG: cytochrome c [Deltaproteobacteria bacterium]|nr:cytochrome c [Deltaproteobacteria bacterium]
MRAESVVDWIVVIVSSIILVLIASWVTLVVAASPGDAAKGKEIYAKSCAGCHGATGKGDGAAAAALNPKPKDLSDKAYVSKLDDKYLFNIMAKGGPSVGKSPLMPPFGGNLKEQDIKDVVAFIRSLAK